jgi:methylmalonyl-CoA mutase cobalamin-binding subunit
MSAAGSELPGTEPARAGRPVRVMISAGFSAGHALPALALARALRERDHEVVVHL